MKMKKLLSLALATAMALSLVACGGNSGSSAGSVGAASSGAASSGESELEYTKTWTGQISSAFEID